MYIYLFILVLFIYFFLILFFNFTILYWFLPYINMNPPQVYLFIYFKNIYLFGRAESWLQPAGSSVTACSLLFAVCRI